MWRMNVSQRVKMFNWKLLWGRLPTSEWFGKHSGCEVEKCYLCKEGNDGITHIFFERKSIEDYWRLIEEKLNVQFKHKDEWKDGKWLRESDGYQYESAECLKAFMTVLCKENKRKDTRERKGRELVENRKEIALLCDAAWSGSSKVGCGFVLKGEDDEVLAKGSGLEAANNPLYPEAKAIWFGLDNVRKRQIKRIQVWTDCKRLMNILKGEFQAPWNISLLINKIKRMAGELEVLKWSHVSSERNEKAHMLARKALKTWEETEEDCDHQNRREEEEEVIDEGDMYDFVGIFSNEPIVELNLRSCRRLVCRAENFRERIRTRTPTMVNGGRVQTPNPDLVLRVKQDTPSSPTWQLNGYTVSGKNDCRRQIGNSSLIEVAGIVVFDYDSRSGALIEASFRIGPLLTRERERERERERRMGAAEVKNCDAIPAMGGEREAVGDRATDQKGRAQDAAPLLIPSSPLTIDISIPLDQMRPQIIYLCKDLFKKRSCLDESCFSIETVSGGITNLLLKVSIREDNDKIESLTVRLYGPNTDLVIDRKREMQALPHLSAAGFGAKLLGVFGNGMVQSFIDARTLSPSVFL
ncbi:hypothetical protein Cni_G02795 [Canna indica]|uniref:ethanolamine kinase n=1 Tax=Canna indica TaxID=4628 RepID=A0AAQ3JRG2_9LILI|nr:hypothetical protein Cni_G02795 [Canna indica]